MVGNGIGFFVYFCAEEYDKENKNNVSMVDLLRLVNFILLPLYDNDGRGNIITFIDVIDNEFFLVIY